MTASHPPGRHLLTHRRLLVVVGAIGLLGLIGIAALWPPAAHDPGEVESGQRTRLVDAVLVEVDVLGVEDDPFGMIPGAVNVLVTASLDATGETIVFEMMDETGATFRAGQRVKLAAIEQAGETTYFVSDFRRGRALTVLGAMFLTAVIGFGRWQGVRALTGLLITFLVLAGFIVPAIIAGRSPMAVALAGSAIIMIVTLYLSHGVSEKTTAAVVGTTAALIVTGLLSLLFVEAAAITGMTSEEARLANYEVGGLSLQGLLLAGIIIGSLGVLDDVTMSQSSTVMELRRANPLATFGDLMLGALNVGRDHIAATVNTLFLAYAGASLPLLLLFTAADDGLGTILNAEIVAVEIVRTLVGSIGLIAAVPLTTALAAALAAGGAPLSPAALGGGHSHGPPHVPGPGQATPETDAAAADPEWERRLREAYRLPERPPAGPAEHPENRPPAQG